MSNVYSGFSHSSPVRTDAPLLVRGVAGGSQNFPRVAVVSYGDAGPRLLLDRAAAVPGERNTVSNGHIAVVPTDMCIPRCL